MSPKSTDRKTLTFKLTKIISDAEFVISKKINDTALNDDQKTFVMSTYKHDARYKRTIWLTET